MTEEKLELQFDRAEPSQAPAAAEHASPGPVQCSACGSRLLSYYSLNGKVTCRQCRDAAVAREQGSHLPTLATALGLGLLAAVIGAILYFAVAKITGYEIGLVSIVVGLLVGKGVKKGARGRGGWRYQALAVLLCYVSISVSYAAFAVGELANRQQPSAQAAAEPAAAGAEVGEAPAGAPVKPAAGGEAIVAAPDQPAEGAEPEPSGLAVFVALAAFVLQLPFLVGKESPMTFLLIGIALWEAWKINAEVPFEATGPYAVGGRAPENG